MIPFLFLPLLGCSGLEDAGDFYDEAAAISCKQVLDCDPESWLALDGQKACETTQQVRMREIFRDADTREDQLPLAKQCLEEMAAQECSESIVGGSIPEVCWLFALEPQEVDVDTGGGR